MKIVVVSDSHRDTETLDAIERKTNADIYLHAGDSGLPPELIKPYLSVRGNCDFYHYDVNMIYDVDSLLKIFMTHGHLYSKARIVHAAKANGCKIAIYGHTHIPMIEVIDDIYVINPGSISYPRGNNEKTYIIINYKNDLASMDIQIVPV